MFKKSKNSKPLIQIFIYSFLVLVFLVENNINLGGHKIYSKWDNMIPFIPIFIIPYCLWFLFIAGTGIIFLLKSKVDLKKTFLSINICMGVGLLVYFIYPNYITVRPRVYGKDIFSQAVKFLQDSDSPASVCPSLHVAVSISLCTGIMDSIYFKNRIRIKISSIILTFFICISTLFIKQHSIIDVVFGLILGFASYVFVYKIYYNEKLFSHNTEDDVENELSYKNNNF